MLIDNDSVRIQMGLKARERAINHFSLDKMLDSIYKLYADVIG